jgi:hypothetical protein
MKEGEAVMGPIHHDEGVSHRAGHGRHLEFLGPAALLAEGAEVVSVGPEESHLAATGIDDPDSAVAESVDARDSEELVGLVALNRAYGEDG